MERENKTLLLSEIINTKIFSDSEKKPVLSKIAKHSTIFSFWEDIVGKKYAEISKPYQIKSSKLFISAKSPVVVQELSFAKNKLIEKINTYSKPLGIEIKELVFNYKNYGELTDKKEKFEEDIPIWINNEELEKVEIDDNIRLSIKNSINKISFLTDKQKERLIKKIINNYKVLTIRNIKYE